MYGSSSRSDLIHGVGRDEIGDDDAPVFLQVAAMLAGESLRGEGLYACWHGPYSI